MLKVVYMRLGMSFKIAGRAHRGGGGLPALQLPLLVMRHQRKAAQAKEFAKQHDPERNAATKAGLASFDVC